jgi:hypothetical protein
MKSLKDYIAEQAFIAENPVPGDAFDIELSTDTVIESVVTELTESGDVIIELDEHAVSMLVGAGMLMEDPTMISTAPDSASAIPGWNKSHGNPTGVMSPIHGGAFAPYNRKHDPREWMRHDVKHDEDEEDNHVHVAGINEAEYHGRSVPLGKPMQGDVKKSKVYVRKPNGNIVKVNFGDKTMKIKKSNPKRRKSFRARHNCANPGPRWKARYWSCRAW